MKKLITIFLLVATAFTATAQTKPTKEETVAFIRRTCESAIGKKSGDMMFFGATFNYDNCSIEYLLSPNSHNTTDQYSLIKWENFNGCGCQELDDANAIIECNIHFSTFVKLVRDGKPDTSNGHGTLFNLYIPNSKKESFKKAIERLVEIAKEENKDPFAK